MGKLTHADSSGQAKMVDVSGKAVTARYARASGNIRMKPETFDAIRGNSIAKGDVLSVARIAGIMAAKRTAELIPLCHTVPLSDIEVVLTLDSELPGVHCEATARTIAQTGVEMEAISAVALSLVTIYDMAKAIDKDMIICDISLQEKTGGKSGSWNRSAGA
ncbi:MAG TPA: cyclic pyranopterin monophosphate synthase MoaC [Gemmatimonadaceae bacterium]|nr:cyclic pyranopterin monophosphate synthase MoaC [Gemmatimonadaceae bacterium]